MRTSVNPGRFLVLEGSFQVGASLVDATRDPNVADRDLVFDRESGHDVDLASLLRTFLEDPTERVTGPIRITIEAAR
jgi:hypothetical protein